LPHGHSAPLHQTSLAGRGPPESFFSFFFPLDPILSIHPVQFDPTSRAGLCPVPMLFPPFFLMAFLLFICFSLLSIPTLFGAPKARKVLFANFFVWPTWQGQHVGGKGTSLPFPAYISVLSHFSSPRTTYSPPFPPPQASFLEFSPRLSGTLQTSSFVIFDAKHPFLPFSAFFPSSCHSSGFSPFLFVSPGFLDPSFENLGLFLLVLHDPLFT